MRFLRGALRLRTYYARQAVMLSVLLLTTLVGYEWLSGSGLLWVEAARRDSAHGRPGLWLAAMAAMAFVLAAGLLLLDRLIRPIASNLARLEQFSGNLAQEPGEVVPAGEMQDELARIADAINRMSVALAAERASLTVSNRNTQDSEQRFREFAEIAADWFWETDAEDRYTFVSANVEARGGLAPQTYLGKTRTEVALRGELQGEIAARWETHMEAIARREPFRDVVHQRSSLRGPKLWLRISGTPRLDAEGRFLGYRGGSTNITEQKQIEDSMHRAEERLHTAIESLEDGFVLYDSEDRLEICNRRYREMYPESADLLVPGARFEDIVREGVRRGQYPEAAGREQAWIDARLAAHRELDSAVVQQVAGGRWIRAAERRTSDGGVVGSRIDITELRQAREQAETANQAKSRFLASMSHEIRTPLSGVLGLLQLVRGTPLSGEQAEYLSMAQESADALFEIVNDVLDFSKIEAGHMGIESVAFNPAEEIRRIAHLFEPKTRDKGLELRVRLGADLQQVLLGDVARLRQILRNLVHNAIKFTSHGHIELNASAAPAAAAPGVPARLDVAVEVTDTGVGIPPDRQAQVFEAFTQADESVNRVYGGTGLGLSICRQLAGGMGGRISLTSVLGRGTTFRLELPFDLAPAGIEPRGPVAAASGPESLAGLDTLVLEDNQFNRLVVEKLLARAGATVRSAADVPAGLALFAARRPDLVLTDLQMGDMSGFDMLRAIRACEPPGQRPVPVVVLTANAQAGERERCLAAGMDGYVSKPFSVATLLGEIQVVLHAHGTVAPSHATVDEARDADGAAHRGRFATAIESLDGDPELFAAAAQAGLREFPGRAKALPALLASGEFESIAAQAHKMRYGWSLFAHPADATLPEELEAAADARNEPAVRVALERLIERQSSIEGELREWLAGTVR